MDIQKYPEQIDILKKQNQFPQSNPIKKDLSNFLGGDFLDQLDDSVSVKLHRMFYPDIKKQRAEQYAQ